MPQSHAAYSGSSSFELADVQVIGARHFLA